LKFSKGIFKYVVVLNYLILVHLSDTTTVVKLLIVVGAGCVGVLVRRDTVNFCVFDLDST
jgi:hypothetical protein